MTRRRFALLLFFVVCLWAVEFTAARVALRVNETAIKLLFSDKQTAAVLTVENGTGQNFNAQVQIELLTPHDKILLRAVQDETLRAGANTVNVPLAIRYGALNETERSEFPFYRLRYRVAPDASTAPDAAPVEPTEGIVSLSEITPDLFELSVVAPRTVRRGTHYLVRVHTSHPVTARPSKDVRVEGVVDFDDDKRKDLKLTATTDGEGNALLDFNLPRDTDDHELDVKVAARRGIFTQEADADIEFDEAKRMLLTTDKSLYQPGQALHMRVLLFDSSRRAVSGEAATLKVTDPDGATVFNAPLKTSRFGVASADWQIPDNTRLGDYWVKIETEDDDHYGEDSISEQMVKISRYDLPNFAVNAKPDRPFYLGGQNAEVEVRGDYLFGQPVTRGRVRVVEQVEREWNYKEQKYETKEGQSVEGKLDAAGRFVARLDLGEHHRELAETSYQRFRDIRFAAYITDETTNRTEQRRFMVRLTKEAIHLYVVEGRYDQAAGMPLAFYLSTSYADGTPASCDVEISAGRESEAEKPKASNAEPQTSAAPVLLKVKTNRYGVAKVKGPVVGSQMDASDNHVALGFRARDHEGRVGTHAEDFWMRSDKGTEIRVETNKTLYRAGEPVEVEVTAARPELVVFLDVAHESRVVASKTLRLHEGRAVYTFPYTEDFKEKLSITASAYEPDNGDDDRRNYYRPTYASGTRNILYPRNRELKLDVHFDKSEYRPGDDASAELKVHTPDGRRVEGALGVVVFDQAVEERARTEQEFGSFFGFRYAFRDFWYGGGDIAGVTPRDIEQLDMSKPVGDDMNDVAELLFNGSGYSFEPRIEHGTTFTKDQPALFNALNTLRLNPVERALNARYEKQVEYPHDDAHLRQILLDAGINFDSLPDPWGMPYRAAFSVERDRDMLEFICAGADKKAGTEDDFPTLRVGWPYFRLTGERIDRAVAAYHGRTGGHVRDAATLKSELARAGLDFDALRDAWGQPYVLSFGLSATSYTVNIKSGGPDRRYAEGGVTSADDFNVWTSLSDYFAGTREAIERALSANMLKSKRFPQTEADLRQVLGAQGIALDDLRDAWGRRLTAVFSVGTRYANRLQSRDQYNPAGATATRNEIKPVVQIVYYIKLMSAGPNEKVESDDFVAGIFSSVVAQENAQAAQPNAIRIVKTLFGSRGAIQGTVTDPQGASIPNAIVKAKHKYANLEFTATTNEDGLYLLRDLPPGYYTLAADSPGFQQLLIDNVYVQSSNLTKLDLTLDVGGVMETVAVTAGEPDVINTTTAQVNMVVKRSFISPPQLSTPRLREFFPETLVWQPDLETDKDGRAQLRFKFADNITTWKVSVIGSTADGELGLVEQEIRAFQPFFVEHDPPRILTEGDEIELPVVLRNYLETRQAVDVEIKPEDWFTLNGPARKHREVASGDAARETFGFRAVSSVTDGKQRITARGADASDAIEKPVSVHPDGEELAATAAQIFNDAGALDVAVSPDAIQGSLRGELKIYPNLSAHVVESVEAIMRRPYGCGEQTISSTYPSLLVLRYYERQSGAGVDKEKADKEKADKEKADKEKADKEKADKKRDDATRRADALPVAAGRARRYLDLGYKRLLGYRASDGGFTYWGHGDSNFALTAYALKFLTDARAVIEVDEDVIDGARDFLVARQSPDGSWPANYDTSPAQPLTALNTAYIARTLARTESLKASSSSNNEASKKTAAALARALRYLSGRIEDINEPYLLAAYALAAVDAGNQAEAARAAAKLRALAHEEVAGESYWSLATNTPFYGWGRAGRIETTALVVQALARAGETNANDALINRGLLFLLRRKDPYGVWMSTQATINVLDAMILLSSNRASSATGATTPDAAQTTSGGATDLFVNGQRAASVTLPSSSQLSNPVIVNVSQFLSATGNNRVEIRRTGAAPALPAQAQLVVSYYVPWSKSPSVNAARALVAEAGNNATTVDDKTSAVSLNVQFDRTNAEINQPITCRVEAARTGRRGYGMLLGEIGLPPGADVDRASLDRAMQESGGAFNHYDVLPDKLVVYLWPYTKGQVNFDFKFRPRFGLNAQSAASQLYDYYNPDARTLLAPTRFVIR